MKKTNGKNGTAAKAIRQLKRKDCAVLTKAVSAWDFEHMRERDYTFEWNADSAKTMEAIRKWLAAGTANPEEVADKVIEIRHGGQKAAFTVRHMTVERTLIGGTAWTQRNPTYLAWFDEEVELV